MVDKMDFYDAKWRALRMGMSVETLKLLEDDGVYLPSDCWFQDLLLYGPTDVVKSVVAKYKTIPKSLPSRRSVMSYLEKASAIVDILTTEMWALQVFLCTCDRLDPKCYIPIVRDIKREFYSTVTSTLYYHVMDYLMVYSTNPTMVWFMSNVYTIKFPMVYNTMTPHPFNKDNVKTLLKYRHLFRFSSSILYKIYGTCDMDTIESMLETVNWCFSPTHRSIVYDGNCHVLDRIISMDACNVMFLVHNYLDIFKTCDTKYLDRFIPYDIDAETSGNTFYEKYTTQQLINVSKYCTNEDIIIALLNKAFMESLTIGYSFVKILEGGPFDNVLMPYRTLMDVLRVEDRTTVFYKVASMALHPSMVLVLCKVFGTRLVMKQCDIKPYPRSLDCNDVHTIIKEFRMSDPDLCQLYLTGHGDSMSNTCFEYCGRLL